MAIPSDGCNLVGVSTLAVDDLGLAATVTSVAAETSTVFHTCIPATVVVLSKLSSGSGQITLDKADTAANINHSSPDNTLSCSGTAYQTTVLNTDSAALYVGLEQTSGSTAVWADLKVLVLYELKKNNFGREDAVTVKSAINSMSADNGLSDGSGVLVLTINS